MKRWTATIVYLPEHMKDIDFSFDEFEELGKEIEQGPDWNHINTIIITLNK